MLVGRALEQLYRPWQCPSQTKMSQAFINTIKLTVLLLVALLDTSISEKMQFPPQIKFFHIVH